MSKDGSKSHEQPMPPVEQLSLPPMPPTTSAPGMEDIYSQQTPGMLRFIDEVLVPDMDIQKAFFGMLTKTVRFSKYEKLSASAAKDRLTQAILMYLATIPKRRQTPELFAKLDQIAALYTAVINGAIVPQNKRVLVSSSFTESSMLSNQTTSQKRHKGALGFLG